MEVTFFRRDDTRGETRCSITSEAFRRYVFPDWEHDAHQSTIQYIYRRDTFTVKIYVATTRLFIQIYLGDRQMNSVTGESFDLWHFGSCRSPYEDRFNAANGRRTYKQHLEQNLENYLKSFMESRNHLLNRLEGSP